MADDKPSDIPTPAVIADRLRRHLRDIEDRDSRKPPGRHPSMGAPHDDISPEDITERHTIIESASIRAALVRMQDRIDEVADGLRDEAATGLEQSRQRVGAMANDVQVLLLKLESLRVELTGLNGSNGKMGNVTRHLDEVRSQIRASEVELKAIREAQADQARTLAESTEGRRSITNWMRTVIGGVILSLGAAAVAVYAAGYKKSGEDSHIRQLDERTQEMRLRQDKILSALCRAGMCNDLFQPASGPAPTGVTP